MQALSLALAGLGGYIIYKALTTTFGEPHVMNMPKHTEFWGNDKMTFIQGLHAENRLEPIETAPVTEGLAHASINGALFEVNPNELTPPQFKLPATKYVKTF